MKFPSVHQGCLGHPTHIDIIKYQAIYGYYCYNNTHIDTGHGTVLLQPLLLLLLLRLLLLLLSLLLLLLLLLLLVVEVAAVVVVDGGVAVVV